MKGDVTIEQRPDGSYFARYECPSWVHRIFGRGPRVVPVWFDYSGACEDEQSGRGRRA